MELSLAFTGTSPSLRVSIPTPYYQITDYLYQKTFGKEMEESGVFPQIDTFTVFSQGIFVVSLLGRENEFGVTSH